MIRSPGGPAPDPATTHRPSAPAILAREAASLVGTGLTIGDVAAALNLTPRAVADLLDPINLED